MEQQSIRLLVCGGRDFGPREFVAGALDSWCLRVGAPDLVIAGGAPGADTWAAWWARQRGFVLRVFPADWSAWGRRAGMIRNQEMFEVGRPTHLVAFPGGAGTRDMVGRAKAAAVRITTVAADGTLINDLDSWKERT